MSTARSPLRKLKAEADRMAAQLKAMERGDVLANDPKLIASKQRGDLTFGVIMDDKTLKITMAWAKIEETSEAGLAEFILRHMRDSREATH